MQRRGALECKLAVVAQLCALQSQYSVELRPLQLANLVRTGTQEQPNRMSQI